MAATRRTALRAAYRTQEHEAAIRDALAEGRTADALTEAARGLRSETAKLRRRHPADAALLDAQLTGQLLAIAATVHEYRSPRRLRGMPQPTDLLAAFHTARAETLGEDI